MRIAIIIAAIGLASSVQAAPYYVGENLKPSNNVTLNFQDTMVKDSGTTTGDTANIASAELRGAYNVSENVALSLGLPFFMASKDLTGKAKNWVGNGWAQAAWINTIPTSDREMTWGYNASFTGYVFSTGDRAEASLVAGANPTTDYYRYLQKATSAVGTIGLFMMQDQFSAKLNTGYGFTRSSSDLVASSDKNKHTFTAQLAGSWHAMPNLHLNTEYNTIYGTEAAFGNHKFKHAITPSVSGNYEAFMGSLYGTIPLDSTTRDVTNVAFGLNVGYTF